MHKVAALLALACTHSLITHAQYCIENRFAESEYFSDEEIVIQNNISYGLADDWYSGVPQPVLNSFNIAYPDLSIDELDKRPLIVLAHGGGFWGGTKEDLDYHVQRLAKSGYVAVTMNYRKGWDGNPIDCLGDPNSLESAIYKAMQDTRACMRYLVANAQAYGIDTSWIILGGESAGAYATMNSIYLSQEEWNLDHADSETVYGSLDGSTNELETTYSIKAFVNMWGGVLDTMLVAPEELKPTISFYGTSDDVIPPGAGHIQFCDAFEHVNGSLALSEHLSNNGVCNHLHEHFMYGHEAYENDYTTGNIACFVKGLLCDECSTRLVHFEEASCAEMVLGIDETEHEWLKMYPNPASTFVTIQSPVVLEPGTSVALADITGKMISPTAVVSANTITLDVSKLVDGIYLVSIQDGDAQLTGKIVVTK